MKPGLTFIVWLGFFGALYKFEKVKINTPKFYYTVDSVNKHWMNIGILPIMYIVLHK